MKFWQLDHDTTRTSWWFWVKLACTGIMSRWNFLILFLASTFTGGMDILAFIELLDLTWLLNLTCFLDLTWLFGLMDFLTLLWLLELAETSWSCSLLQPLRVPCNWMSDATDLDYLAYILINFKILKCQNFKILKFQIFKVLKL